jgi:hypothetical protein
LAGGEVGGLSVQAPPAKASAPVPPVRVSSPTPPAFTVTGIVAVADLWETV